jgi:hypothetical protein
MPVRPAPNLKVVSATSTSEAEPPRFIRSLHAGFTAATAPGAVQTQGGLEAPGAFERPILGVPTA